VPARLAYLSLCAYVDMKSKQASAKYRKDIARDEDWGELHVRGATPDAGSEWTDDGSPRERRQLKHWAEGDSRIAPTHPELTRLLRDHWRVGRLGLEPRTGGL
jgi:hypothetical protein